MLNLWNPLGRSDSYRHERLAHFETILAVGLALHCYERRRNCR
jgi:hypothetical protein